MKIRYDDTCIRGTFRFRSVVEDEWDMNQLKQFVSVFISVSVVRKKNNYFKLNNYFDSTKYVVKFFWVGAFTGTTTCAVN